MMRRLTDEYVQDFDDQILTTKKYMAVMQKRVETYKNEAESLGLSLNEYLTLSILLMFDNIQNQIDRVEAELCSEP